jgi:transposase
MLTLTPAVRVFVHLGPTDMRRSFDGLAAIVREIIQADPMSGHLFVFFNRRRDRVKILVWDRTGLCLWYKRLEEGVFKLPEVSASDPPSSVEMNWADLSLILEGIDLAGAKRGKRFQIRQSA